MCIRDSELADENLIIEINSAEELILNGERLNEFSYTSLNNFIIDNYPDSKKAVISADSDTRYQYLVTVMDVLNNNNFNSVEISAIELK